ncbi:hypothetical protein MKZ38_010506 [Zalerion maritima]|uniref:BSD domain-containing protein n=1 Tax=Zalerion maritima TaxID=339359 RepID=A0AAD5RFM5_9PEZI|nr:hypothetical protein MKZ38_010506 [Zalerion maritima]
MALPGGKVSYKKQDGFITLSSDQNSVVWGPLGAPTSQTLAITDITNLQQTPATSTKVILKIIAKTAAGEPANHLFHFTSPDARAEADAFKTILSQLVADAKSSDPSIPKPSGSGTPALSVTSAPAPKPSLPKWMDDNALKQDIELQQSLMKKDTALHALYMEGRIAKADTVSDSAWNAMFWSQRTELLRAHAIETEQQRGPVNILTVVKPKTVDGELKLNMSMEQTKQIFEQHPLVRRVFDEMVPKKLDYSTFWSRFFLSKLSKKLKGSRLTDNDTPDAIFDRYLNHDNSIGFTPRITQGHVPHSIDIEGNEENQGGFKGGNRPDAEMRPGRRDGGLVAALNSISTKIMANVAPSDPMIPDGGSGPNPESNAEEIDNALQGELMLRDLSEQQKPESIPLTIRDQDALVSGANQDVNADLEDDAMVFGSRTPQQALDELRNGMADFENGKTDMHTLIGVDDESDSDSEGEEETAKGTKRRRDGASPRVGSKKARRAAQNHIINAIVARRITEYGSQDPSLVAFRTAIIPAATLPGEELKAEKRARAKAQDATAQLTPTMEQKSIQMHATTVEFLRLFRSAFHSGDSERAAELESLDQSLKRSKERIVAIADEAEIERLAAFEIEKSKARELYKKTGQKIYPKKDGCPGGREAVLGRFSAMLESLGKACAEYENELAKEGLRPTVEV